jgi:hypothetical protein
VARRRPVEKGGCQCDDGDKEMREEDAPKERFNTDLTFEPKEDFLVTSTMAASTRTVGMSICSKYDDDEEDAKEMRGDSCCSRAMDCSLKLARRVSRGEREGREATSTLVEVEATTAERAKAVEEAMFSKCDEKKGVRLRWCEGALVWEGELE